MAQMEGIGAIEHQSRVNQEKLRQQMRDLAFKEGDVVDFWTMGIWHLRWTVKNVRNYPTHVFDRPVYVLMKGKSQRLVYKDFNFLRFSRNPHTD